MPEKKKQKKNGSHELEYKIDIIYEILAEHKSDLVLIESKIEELSGAVGKVKGRMGL